MLFRSKKKVVRKKAAKKKARGKRRGRPKMITHRHSTKTRHLKKGSVLRVEAVAGKGRKKVKLTGKLKVNPRHRRNPSMAQMLQKYVGVSTEELTSLAIGGALIPVINGGLKKFAPQVVGMVNQYAGAQFSGTIVSMIGGVALNALAEHVVTTGQGHKWLKLAGEGVAAASVVGLALNLSQRWVAPTLGLGAVIYSPDFKGINYTPMHGINYTPMHGYPQLGDGYTEAHKFSKADFGRGADFGGADFGEMPMDMDVDEAMDPDQISEGSLAGSMG